MTIQEEAPTSRVPQWTLGERLRKAREWAGLDIPEMADKLSVSKAAISSWETETRRPRDVLGTINQWARITGVPLDWILDMHPGTPGNATVADFLSDQRLFDPDSLVHRQLVEHHDAA